MKGRSNRLNNPIQLQQKVIYFQSELTKCQKIIADYENNYHVIQFQELKEENDRLKKELLTMKKNNDQLNDEKLLETIQQLKEEKSQIEETLAAERKEFDLKLTQLQKEIEELNRENIKSHSEEADNLLSVDEMKIINELDTQFKDLLIESFNNDKLLDPKSILIKELEDKINLLTKEIEEMETSDGKSIK